MPNTLLNPTVIAKEALVLLKNNLVMGANVHRDYKNEFVKVGSTVNIRKPVRFVATKSAILSKSNVTEYNTNVKVDTQAHVGWEFSSQELTLTIEQYSERYMQPAIAALANQVDFDLTSLYDDVNNEVGTPGTTPNSFAALGAGLQRLDELAAPNHQRKVVLDPAGYWSMADALKGTFDPKMTRDAVRKGFVGMVGNAETFMDQNIRKHTVGAHGGTPLVNGASTAGDTTIATDGWTVDTVGILKAGDVFTIAGVYEVNPMSGDSTGVLKQFVALEDVDSGATTGPATIRIYPAGDSGPGLQASGAYKNCSALPADNAAITVLGAASTQYPQNLAFQKGAFGLVVRPLQMPDGVWGQRVTDPQSGLSIRVIKDYDIDNDKEILRMDILYGTKTLYPDLACRITG